MHWGPNDMRDLEREQGGGKSQKGNNDKNDEHGDSDVSIQGEGEVTSKDEKVKK